MLKSVISRISEALADKGAQHIYSAFDNIPVAYKGKDIFNIVGIEGFESSVPIYSQYNVFIPFKADAAVSVAAPPDYPAEKLYSYFDKHVLPAFESISSLTCSLKKLVIKKDSSVNRLVLKANFSVSGITRLERSSV